MGSGHTALRRRLIAAAAILLSFATPSLLAQWLNYRELSAPTPRAPDGKPDLSGVWESERGYVFDLAKDLMPGDVEMLPWAKTLQAQRETTDDSVDGSHNG